MIDIIIPAKEITEANQQQNAACQAVGGCTSSNISTEGHYAFDDRAQNTNATIGATNGTVSVTIRDTEAQAALEDSGQTAAASEINSDLDTAQVITRDKTTNVDFYLSDSSVKGAAELAQAAGVFIEETVQEMSDFVRRALTPVEQEQVEALQKALLRGELTEEEYQKCLTTGHCTTSRGEELKANEGAVAAFFKDYYKNPKSTFAKFVVGEMKHLLQRIKEDPEKFDDIVKMLSVMDEAIKAIAFTPEQRREYDDMVKGNLQGIVSYLAELDQRVTNGDITKEDAALIASAVTLGAIIAAPKGVRRNIIVTAHRTPIRPFQATSIQLWS